MMTGATFTLLLMILHLAPISSSTVPSVKHVTELKLSKSCFDKGYCFEKHELYPQKLVNSLTQQWNIKLHMQDKPKAIDSHDEVDDARAAGADIAAIPSTPKKQDQYLRDENDCAKNVQKDLIYEIVDENNNTRVVVQTDNHIIQLIEVEECVNPGRISTPSMHFDTDIVTYFNLRCVEHVLNYQFLVLNLNWTGIEMVKSKRGIPVACICKFFGAA